MKRLRKPPIVRVRVVYAVRKHARVKLNRWRDCTCTVLTTELYVYSFKDVQLQVILLQPYKHTGVG